MCYSLHRCQTSKPYNDEWSCSFRCFYSVVWVIIIIWPFYLNKKVKVTRNVFIGFTSNKKLCKKRWVGNNLSRSISICWKKLLSNNMYQISMHIVFRCMDAVRSLSIAYGILVVFWSTDPSNIQQKNRKKFGHELHNSVLTNSLRIQKHFSQNKKVI